MGDEMNARHYKIIRNMIVFVGMAVAFVIWLFLPDTFKNSALFHVGNGEYGSKLGVLIILPLPMISLGIGNGKKESYSDDQDYRSQEDIRAEYKNMQLGLITAIALSLLVIALMGLGLVLL